MEQEVRDDPNIILMIDEIHTLVGAGGGGDGGAMDAANILKPALARGDMQIIGATTVEEYRKYVEKDKAQQHFWYLLGFRMFFRKKVVSSKLVYVHIGKRAFPFCSELPAVSPRPWSGAFSRSPCRNPPTRRRYRSCGASRASMRPGLGTPKETRRKTAIQINSVLFRTLTWRLEVFVLFCFFGFVL